jgi:hypothetical protein
MRDEKFMADRAASKVQRSAARKKQIFEMEEQVRRRRLLLLQAESRIVRMKVRASR